MLKNNLIAITLIIFQLSACSTANVQTDRLKAAESYIAQAEQAVSSPSKRTTKFIAENNLGTAKAYLETLRDNKKFLTDAELKTYHALKQRANMLSKRLSES